MVMTSGNLLLTGRPSVGKTTAVQRAVRQLDEIGVPLRGFITEELRVEQRRVGFAIATFEGEREILAHVEFRSRHRVGRYGVDTEALERLTERALVPVDDRVVYVIDEIGKMECCSVAFVRAVQALLDAPCLVVATIALRGRGPIARFKARTDVQSWEITSANRNRMPAAVVSWVRNQLKTIPP